MATRNDSAQDEDPAAASSDAVSLHTIADQADAYAAQVQEDADFAFALALEDEESRAIVESQRQAQVQSENHAEETSPEQPEAFPPYRDDPDVENNAEHQTEDLTPYRDDPNAEGEQNVDAETATTPTRQRSCIRILRKLGKVWLCCLGISTVLTIVIIGVVIIIALAFPKPNTKDVAWRDSGSRDYDLKLPYLYPALEEGTTHGCKNNWKWPAVTLECHRMILSPAWDDGSADEAKAAAADVWAYSNEICTKKCRASIERLEIRVGERCSRRTDRFNFTSYGKDGRAYFDIAKLEEGPADVVKSLTERYDRLCARPPSGQRTSEWGTCAADMWMRWGIVDGKNEANLNGVDAFLQQTNVSKTILGGRWTGTVEIVGGKKEYSVFVPKRQVGPGAGETECGYCTRDWLERKMKSFDYGEILDPKSGQELDLKEFHQKLRSAVYRCERYEGRRLLERVYERWTSYGWWCNQAPCRKDSKVTDDVRKVLHGMREDDWPLPKIQKMAREKDAPKKALEALHDGLATMPCSIWFTGLSAVMSMVPYQHVIESLCSNQCRNAVDRIQEEHGADFSAAARDTNDRETASLFQAWDAGREQMNAMCYTGARDSFCAPGYAALGHPEWIFLNSTPSKTSIISNFSIQLDKLEKNLPRYTWNPKKFDRDTSNTIVRAFAESVCNACAAELLIGPGLDYREKIKEFLNDVNIDGREYTKTAKKYFLTCGKMATGEYLSKEEQRRMWQYYGLNRFD